MKNTDWHCGLRIHSFPVKCSKDIPDLRMDCTGAMFFSPEEKFGLVLITNGCNKEQVDGWNPLLKGAAQVLYRNYIQ